MNSGDNCLDIYRSVVGALSGNIAVDGKTVRGSRSGGEAEFDSKSRKPLNMHNSGK